MWSIDQTYSEPTIKYVEPSLSAYTVPSAPGQVGRGAALDVELDDDGVEVVAKDEVEENAAVDED